jgi:GT2 family glycosyltransferase
MEEIDLCWRMKKLGYAVYYHGGSTVFHVGGGTLSKLSPKKTFLNFRNGLFLIYKNFRTSELILKLPTRILLDYLAAFRFLLSGEGEHALAILKAHYFFIQSMGNLTQKRKLLPNSAVENRVGSYDGSIVWDFFIRGKKSITLD